MSSRIVSTWMSRPSGSTIPTFGCRSSSASVHVRHVPHPPSEHSSAAANARTASCLPHPSGPARRYAWCGLSTARSRNAIASACAGTVPRTGRTSSPTSETLREGVVGSLFPLAEELPERLLHVLLHDLRGLVRLDRHEPLGVLLRDLQVRVRHLRVE